MAYCKNATCPRRPATASSIRAAAASRIVDLARGDRSIGRVDDLAERAGVSVRALQRLFHDHVGVSPKWVIRRFRVHEAAERLASGARLDRSEERRVGKECRSRWSPY